MNLYFADDLLVVHGIMMRDLIEEAGMFRARPVGVVDQEENNLYFGTLSDYALDSAMKLLDWTEHSVVHMLIRGCVFHYEYQFVDINVRMGRL